MNDLSFLRMNFAPKEQYFEAFHTASDGSGYRCLGLCTTENGCQFKFVKEETHSRGYIERVAGADWDKAPELPDELVCRELVKSTHFPEEKDSDEETSSTCCLRR